MPFGLRLFVRVTSSLRLKCSESLPTTVNCFGPSFVEVTAVRSPIVNSIDILGEIYLARRDNEYRPTKTSIGQNTSVNVPPICEKLGKGTETIDIEND